MFVVQYVRYSNGLRLIQNTWQRYYANRPKEFHPTQNFFPVFCWLKFAQIRKANTHCPCHPIKSKLFGKHKFCVCFISFAFNHYL